MTEQKYRAWLSCPSMPEELTEELNAMDSDTIHDCFYRDLAFGTGGLRGILGAGTNRMNLFTVMKATRGLASYLLKTCEAPSCAISFDSRIHSVDFAELAAATLADMGIRVLIYQHLQPTPMLSFAIRHHAVSAGIMITASHNPAAFNGYKVYGSDGCQITPEAAEQILNEIRKQPDLTDRLPDFRQHLSDGTIQMIPEETIEAYYQAVLKLSVRPVSRPLHVVYSPLNGTGNVPVREILKRLGSICVDVVAEQELPDGRFPTCPCPNPEVRDAMTLAIRKTIETGADFCFATDPDCDRLGVGERSGDEVVLISGNDMGILMLDYLCRRKPRRTALPPVVIKTIVTTEMASSVCRKYGLELRNVLTGFKFIGEQIGLLEKAGQRDRFLFGFEESYGYLSGTDVRDKDAVNAALLLYEMAADLKSDNKTMLERLHELRCEFGFFAQRLLTFEYAGENGANTMKRIMESLRKPLASLEIPLFEKAVRTDYLLDSTGLPSSDVLLFALPEDLKIVVRPSGTEPKLKAYLFARSDSQDAAENALDQLQDIVQQVCRQ